MGALNGGSNNTRGGELFLSSCFRTAVVGVLSLAVDVCIVLAIIMMF